MMTTDLEPLVAEILANGRHRTPDFSRSDAVRHIHQYRENLVREGRIPPNTALHDNGIALEAVES